MTETTRRISEALAVRFGEEIPVDEHLPGAETLAVLVEHRTIRRYRDEPIDAALLRLICASALTVPSKSDLQQADIVSIADPTIRESVAALIPSMPWVRQAPEFLVVCGNGRRLRQLYELGEETFANDHLDAFFNPAVDAGLVLGHLLVAAEAVGLGTCPISVLRDHSSRVSELLALPPWVFPVAGLCLGWPAEERRISPRLPLALTLQRDRYVEEDWAEHIETYDHRRARLDGFDPNGPDTVVWSRQKTRMYAVAQRTDFGAFVRGRGFDLT